MMINKVVPLLKARFCSTAAAKLQRILEDEIKYEAGNKPPLNQHLDYFKSNNWTMTQKGSLIEFAQDQKLYRLRVLVSIRSPLAQNETEQPGAEEGLFDNLTAMHVFTNKTGVQKWLYAGYLYRAGTVSIGNATIVNDYSRELVTGSFSRDNYIGPEMEGLPTDLHDRIGLFLQDLGIQEEFLKQIYEFSNAYEHQFYLRWLQDLKSIV